MYLINAKTLELENFVGTPPEYVILSHTWGDDEVSYSDFQDTAKRLDQLGFRKIELTCTQAQRDGFNYAWVDTCCINKSSSAELSEAINSMFKWYRDAQKCYAYIEDLVAGDMASVFGSCKWFTRGWTLQELIAPRKLTFYGPGWISIGEKDNLSQVLESITGIDKSILQHTLELSSISIAKRMSWAAGRKATRKEDIAYCLMGLFDVNMPMLYGEGEKAFERLQDEILKQTEDDSLFAWRATAGSAPYRGLFAASPDEFQNSHKIVPFRNLSGGKSPPSLTSRGVLLTGFFHLEPARGNGAAIIGLNCSRNGAFSSVICIEIVGIGGDNFLRSSPSTLKDCPSHGVERTVYIAKSGSFPEAGPLVDLRLQNGICIVDLPEDVNIVHFWPNVTAVDYGYWEGLRTLPLNWCIDRKTALQLECTWSDQQVLVVMWVTRIPGSDACNYLFDTKITSQIHARKRFARARSAEVDVGVVQRTVSVGKAPRLLITGQQGKVKGFDMFCIHVELEKPKLRGRVQTFQLPHDQSALSASRHRRSWKELPANFCLVFKEIAAYRPFWQLLLLAFPLGIVAAILDWPLGIVISANALSLIPLGVDLYFLRDRIANCLDNISNGVLYVLSNNLEALVFLFFVFWSQQTLLVKSVTLKALILGLLTCKLLLVTGVSFLLGGFANMRAIDGSGTLQVFKPISGVSSIPVLVMCCIVIVPVFSVLFRLDRRDHPKAFYSVMVTASRWISMTLFSVFVLKLLFQLRTHSTLFDLADGKEAETDDDADDADDDDDEHIRRPSLDLSALAMVFLLLFLAITICAYNLAAALSRLDVSEPDYSLAPSEMQRFISLIFFTILPIVLEIPGGLKFVSLAIENRMDLAVQANLESIIHIFLFHTPVLVLTGWIMGTDLALDFKDTQMFAAGLSIVLTMHYIQNGASTYLNGAMMISLYVVISVAISLDGIWF